MQVINSKRASPRPNQLTLGKFIKEATQRRSLLFSLRLARHPTLPSKVGMVENNVPIRRRITKTVIPIVLAKTSMEPIKVVSHKAKVVTVVTIIIIIVMEDSNSIIIVILQAVEMVEAAEVVEMWVDIKIKTSRPMRKQ